MKKQNKNESKHGYACPYKDMGCDKIDTLYMVKIPCYLCEHYKDAKGGAV